MPHFAERNSGISCQQGKTSELSCARMNIATNFRTQPLPGTAFPSLKLLCALATSAAIFTSFAADGTGVGLRKIAEGFVSPTGYSQIPGSPASLLSDQVGVMYLLGEDG